MDWKYVEEGMHIPIFYLIISSSFLVRIHKLNRGINLICILCLINIFIAKILALFKIQH